MIWAVGQCAEATGLLRALVLLQGIDAWLPRRPQASLLRVVAQLVRDGPAPPS